MAFRYLDSGATLHGNAEVVTNNHFDQDGFISVYALSRPDDALARRTLLEDVAAAGDFAIYRDRRAARLSMIIAAFADPERSPLDLTALAGRLTERETNGVIWSADPVSSLTPQLSPIGDNRES